MSRMFRVCRVQTSFRRACFFIGTWVALSGSSQAYGQGSEGRPQVATLQIMNINLSPISMPGRPFGTGACCNASVTVMPLDAQHNPSSKFPQFTISLLGVKSKEEAVQAVKPAIASMLDDYRQALDHIEFTTPR